MSPPPHAHAALSDIIRKYFVVALVPIFFIVFSALMPSEFFTLTNVRTLLGTNAVVLLLAIGVTVVAAQGDFDLSFGGTVGLVPAVVVTLISHSIPDGVAIVIGLLVAVLIGVINSIIVVRMGADSFIITLGMGTLTEGIGLALTASSTIPNNSKLASTIMVTTIGGFQLAVLYSLVATVLLWFITERTISGRHLYFTGEGREAARLAGVRVNRIRYIGFIVSATLAGVAGLALLAETGAVDATYGQEYVLPVFAAIFLGYSTIRVGRVNAFGTLAGVLLIAIGTTGLELESVPSWVTEVFSGGILVVAVAAAILLGQRRILGQRRGDAIMRREKSRVL